MRRRSAHVGMAGALLVSAAIGACSGSVDVAASAGASASGSGGSTGSSGATTATAASTSGQGGGPAFCGGELGSNCPAGEFCAYASPGTCGNADGGGVCKPAPAGCTDDCPGVCGCDGKIYCNACSANAAGVDVSTSSACFADGGAAAIYSGQEIFTNLSRFALFKADPARDLCFRIVLEMGGGSAVPGIATPAGWDVGMAEVTDHASDCASTNGNFPAPPIGKSVKATGGKGTIDFPANGPHCFVTVHASLSFPQSAPWVPANEPLDADMLMIEGACPP
jgi:hypothetical protein